MIKFTFIRVGKLIKYNDGVEDIGIRYTFECGSCKNHVHLDTFEESVGRAINDAIKNSIAPDNLHCHKCDLLNSIRLNS